MGQFFSKSPPQFPFYGTGGMLNDRGQVLFNATLTDKRGVLLVATPTH
jgi:hypothetical protein